MALCLAFNFTGLVLLCELLFRHFLHKLLNCLVVEALVPPELNIVSLHSVLQGLRLQLRMLRHIEVLVFVIDFVDRGSVRCLFIILAIPETFYINLEVLSYRDRVVIIPSTILILCNIFNYIYRGGVIYGVIGNIFTFADISQLESNVLTSEGLAGILFEELDRRF